MKAATDELMKVRTIDVSCCDSVRIYKVLMPNQLMEHAVL